MLKGLRTADAPILQRLCAGDTRLYLRLGALLQAQVSITEAALEAAVATSTGKQLLNDRRLKDIPPHGFAALVEEHGSADLGLVLADAESGAEAGWRVIALEDEVGNPLLAAAAEPVVEALPDATTFSHMMSTLTPALRGPVEGLLQARADDQRAAALEQLRYAAPPLTVVSELMPMLLADAAEVVRERAIGLLVACGASISVVDLIRALHRRDEAALARLAESLANLPSNQLDLVVSALVATATRGHTQGVVNLCHHLAKHLITYPGLDRLIELLLPTRLSLLPLIRALQEHDAPRMESILHRFLGQGAELDASIIMLLALQGNVADDDLLTRGVNLLLEPEEDPKERMALAGALRRLSGDGKRLVTLICKRHGTLDDSHDTSIYWLIAELCRDGAIVGEDAETLAKALRRLLREAPGPHLVAILEQQLPVLIPASNELRGALVEPLVEIVARFRDQRSMDLVAACLSGIGIASTKAMWLLLEEHPHETVRLLAADLLPQLIAQGDPSLVSTAINRFVRGLERAQQARERGALVTAAARLAYELHVDEATTVRIDKTTVGLGEWAIDALGYLAAAEHCPDSRRREIIEQLLTGLTEEIPDRPVETVRDEATDEMTYVLDASLGAHTQNIPLIIASLYRVSTAPHLPSDSLNNIVENMCKQWKAVANWQTIWGPANIQELGQMLGKMAGRLDFPGPLRVRICEALLPKLNQLSIARALARVFVAADGPYLSNLAGKACDRLVQLASDRYYAEDEWPDMVEVLIDYLVIPHMGSDGDAIRRRLVNVIQANRTHMASRARAKLRAIIPDLSEDQQARLDWV